MTTSRRTTLKALGALGAGSVLAGGSVFAIGEHEDDEREPADDEDEVENGVPEGAVRVAHFAPDAPNVDVFVDGDQVITDAAYDSVTPYLELEPGTYDVMVTAAGDEDTVVFDEEVTVAEAFYTLAAIGELEADTFEILPLTDAGSALVRLVHASPDAPAVDVVESESGMPLFANVSFGESTNYLAVAAGSYTLDVVPAGEDEATTDEDEPGDDPEDEDEYDDAAAEDDHKDDEYDDEEAAEDDHEDEEPAEEEAPAEAVASVTVDLEMGTAYTAFAAGFLEPADDQEDRAFAVNLTVDGPGAAEDKEMEAEPDDDYDDEPDEEPDDDYDDEPDDEEMEDDYDDTDDEDEVSDDEDADDY